jgi:hypothetical protein
MKKTLISAMALLGIAMATMTSCKRNDEVSTTTQSNGNARVVFQSIDEYESLFEDPTQTEAKTNEIAARYGTYTENARLAETPEDTLYPEFLQKILNDDHIVEIGNWLIKVNMENKVCSVLDKQYVGEYKDLANDNFNNSHIQIYSTDEEVLNLLRAGKKSEASRLFCSEDGAPSPSAGTKGYDKVSINLAYVLEPQKSYLYEGAYYVDPEYLKLGIYFELKSHATSYQDNGNGSYSENCMGGEIKIWGKYKVACENGDKYFENYGSLNYGSCGKMRAICYKGSKKLSKYELSINVTTAKRDFYSNYKAITTTRTVKHGY